MVSDSCQWIVRERRRGIGDFRKGKLPLVWEEREKKKVEQSLDRCAADMRVYVRVRRFGVWLCVATLERRKARKA